MGAKHGTALQIQGRLFYLCTVLYPERVSASQKSNSAVSMSFRMEMYAGRRGTGYGRRREKRSSGSLAGGPFCISPGYR